MSLVERALKKMQADARPASRQVFGKVVSSIPVSDVAPAAASPVRLVTIDQSALRAAGLLPPEHQKRQLANQYRQIKRPLVASALGRGRPRLQDGQLIMIASAMPGEGKTFTSINLAFSMANEKDVQVVLVDADVAKPQVSRMFGIAAERGLQDAISDPNVDIESLVLATDIPNLCVLSAGTRSDHATELFASDRMVHVMREFVARDPSRIVLFDSPPVLLTTESPALAQIVGQIVVVVRADETQQHVLLDALSHLPVETSTSLVLNRSVAKDGGRSYYYGYGLTEDSEQGSPAP